MNDSVDEYALSKISTLSHLKFIPKHARVQPQKPLQKSIHVPFIQTLPQPVSDKALTQPKIELKKRGRKLLFEWENADDTSKQGMPLLQPVRFQRLSFQKHSPSKNSQEMTLRDWRIYREDNQIQVKGGRICDPIREWTEAALNPKVLENLFKHHYNHPKPIQAQAVPLGLHRKDMIALAPTGQGKTLAFLVPLIEFLLTMPLAGGDSVEGPFSMILVPTRELAQQIAQDFEKIAEGTGLRQQTIIGGYDAGIQSTSIRFGRELIVGTPGRIADLLRTKFLGLQKCYWLIIDEADCMLDFGFEEEIEQILKQVGVSVGRQNESFRVTHMFSATMNDRIEKLATQYLRDYSRITVGEPGIKAQLCYRVSVLEEPQKKHRLISVLQKYQPLIIIFVAFKQKCEEIGTFLKKEGFYSTAIYHGGLPQEERHHVLQQFKQRKLTILVTTDLAARGLHVEAINLVIHYDAPKSMNHFIHRSGRAGRSGKQGHVWAFLTARDSEIGAELRVFLEKVGQGCADLERLCAGSKEGKHKSVIYSQ